MNSLTLTFDQSLGRGSERTELEEKLRNLLECRVHALGITPTLALSFPAKIVRWWNGREEKCLRNRDCRNIRLIAVEVFG